MARGVLITFEGPEGGGKTSQARALAAELEAAGRPVRRFAEPGGTRISEAIRAIILDEQHTEMAPRSELLLFLAARAQLVEQEIVPSLRDGYVVLCDRFTDSTLAYQGVSAGLPVEELIHLNAFATGDLQPDLTLLLDLDPEQGLERQGEWNRMEARGLDFHRQVRAAYLALAQRFPQRIVRIDASRPAEAVAEAIRAAVSPHLR